VAVTWSTVPRGPAVEDVRAAAARWGFPLYERPRKSGLGPLIGELADAFLVRGGRGWALTDRHGTLTVTPGLAMLRIKRLQIGMDMPDQLVRHGELRPGDVVVDATLGLAQDARVMAHVLGPTGRVWGVESSKVIAALLHEGLKATPLPATSAPLEVMHGQALQVLSGLPTGSVDVVLFDPMFDEAQGASPTFEQLRRFADPRPLDVAAVAEARRVARRWVLMKSGSPHTLEALGFPVLAAAPKASVAWGRLPAW